MFNSDRRFPHLHQGDKMLFLDFDPVFPHSPAEFEEPPRDALPPPEPGKLARPEITVNDFRRLKAVLRLARSGLESRGDRNALERHLRTARIVGASEVEPDVVTMNSTVRVFDAQEGRQAHLTVVYPVEAESDAAVSVLSTLGTAILGYRAGQAVGPRTGRGLRRFVIEEVMYQPEAAGDLHL